MTRLRGWADWFQLGVGFKRWVLMLVVGVLVFAAAAFVGVSAIVSYDILENVGLGFLRGQYFVTGALAGIGITLGLVATFVGIRGLVRFGRGTPEGLQILRAQARLGRGPRLVAIGGGTGLGALLGGLKHETSNITAVVTVADDGGSSGVLRRDMGVPPPGDIRSCLVALSDDESLLGRLFQYRFPEGGLHGHSFGNLFLAALAEVTGDFESAVKESGTVLKIRGRVLPATLEDDLQLHAQLEGGEHVSGESSITAAERLPIRVWVTPADPPALPQAVEAILEADLVVLGPGSLYTSIIPNLLIPQVREALEQTQARVVYVCNVMTQPGETDGYTAGDHVEALLRHGAAGIIDAVLVSDTPVPDELTEAYRRLGAAPVAIDEQRMARMGVPVVHGDVAAAGDQFRHDPPRLSAALMRLLQ
jgi:uncharacterized cofD-like protein